jgi:hypothetical protein
MLERRLYKNGEKPTFFKLKKRKFSASLTKKTENLLEPFPSLQSTKGFPTEKKESLSSISLFSLIRLLRELLIRNESIQFTPENIINLTEISKLSDSLSDFFSCIHFTKR